MKQMQVASFSGSRTRVLSCVGGESLVYSTKVHFKALDILGLGYGLNQ